MSARQSGRRLRALAAVVRGVRAARVERLRLQGPHPPRRSTPDRFYAFFASGDLFALTHDGETAWRRDLSGDYGSVAGNHGRGELAAADRPRGDRAAHPQDLLVPPGRRAGHRRHACGRADREPGVAWSTPGAGAGRRRDRRQARPGRVEGFDPATGRRCAGRSAAFRGNHVPSPTVTDDLIYVGGMAVEANLALRRGGSGRARRVRRGLDGGLRNPTFASPFVYGDCVYWGQPGGGGALPGAGYGPRAVGPPPARVNLGDAAGPPGSRLLLLPTRALPRCCAPPRRPPRWSRPITCRWTPR